MTAYPRAIVPVGHVEPVPRRIRAMLGGAVVLDTTAATYLWEWPFYPQYYVPRDDVDAAVLTALAHRTRTSPSVPGAVRFDWEALDAWFEEDEEVVVHPRNPYTRVDALRSTRHVRVELDGVLLAESSAPVLVFETGLPTRSYVHRSAVRWEHLEASGTRTSCPYKGRTSASWSVCTGDALHPDLAWSYDAPVPALAPIAGLVAFYDEQVDVTVDGVRRERPVTHFSDPSPA